MSFLELPEELQMLKKLVRDFRKNELEPLEDLVIEREANRGMGDDPIIPPEVNDQLLEAKEIGLWGIDVPEEYGGVGLGYMAKIVVLEELSQSIVPFILPPETPNLHFLIQGCNEEQKERYLLPYARGEKKSNLALTEPNAGSDAGAIKMSAVKKGNKWVLNGQKTFISGAKNTDFLITLALTDPEKGRKGGITAFLVDIDTPGLEVTRGIPTINEFHPYEVYYDNVELDEGQVLGELGQGFEPLKDRLGVRRIELAMRSVAIAQRALDMMIDYSKVRRTFGQYLADRQSIQWWIADSATDIYANKLMIYDVATRLDNGDKNIVKETSMIKTYATEMATEVVDKSIQAHGGTGVTKDLPLEYMYRLLRIYRIVEGPSEIHRWQIARNLIKSR